MLWGSGVLSSFETLADGYTVMVDAPAEATEASASNVTIEDAGPARKRLNITIPPEKIAEKIDDSLSTLAVEAALPGFRKGKAPRHLLERRFGKNVRDEAKGQLIADAYSSAIEEHGLKALGEPEPVDKIEDIEFDPDKPFTFSIEIEVMPEFDLPDLEKIPVNKPMLEITDGHITDELMRQRLRLGTPSEVEADFKPGDRLLGYATVTKDGEDEPFFRNDDIPVYMPDPDDTSDGQVLGFMVDDLEGMLNDKKVGDQLTITTTGPENHEREDIRGVDLTVTYEIRSAMHIEPATVEAVVEQYGLASEEILNEQIKMALDQRVVEEQSSAMREQVTEWLSDHIDFELPEKITAAQAQRSLENYRLELLYRGLNEDQIEHHVAEARSASEEEARSRLKTTFIMNKLAEHFSVDVNDQEINGRIAAIAAQREMRPDQLRTELTQSGQLNNIAMQIREEKAADKLVAQAAITEVSADEWQKLVEARKEAAGIQTTKKKTTKKKSKTTKKPAAKSSAKKSSTKKTTSKKKTTTSTKKKSKTKKKQ